MEIDEHVNLKDRFKNYPLEPFNKETNVYPYYLTFEKNGVKVNVPIGLDANAYRCVRENSSVFINKLKEQLLSKFSCPQEEIEANDHEDNSTPHKLLTRPNRSKSNILISDTSKKEALQDSRSSSPQPNSLFDDMRVIRAEFRRTRKFYGLSYEDISRAFANCYNVQRSANFLCRLEMCSLTVWKYSQELPLIRRWLADMRIPKKRALLFPPWKLKQTLLMRYEKLACKSITFTKDQLKELNSFCSENANPSNEDFRELKKRLGIPVWKLRVWLKENQVDEQNAH
uniref:POU-specific domain-containing protein n=1 Tax=Mesocestoides corti TaxID=53468 RepID=A0A5K3EHI2_MESCO